MRKKRYYINPLALLFHPQLDSENHFYTIARNPKTEKVFKINPFGYRILKFIDNNPGADIDALSGLTPIQASSVGLKAKIRGFVESMVKENVVFEK